MRYCSLQYSRSDNLGDEIQSLAAEQYLPRIDGFVDRDVGLHAVSESTFVILNGWFKHGPQHWRNDAAHCWPPSQKVHPAFLGFHIAFPDLLADRFLDYYRTWAPIGCRDRGTMEMLQERGVDAYFSRCLTLTFPKREKEPSNGRVYIVEGQERISRHLIPKELAREAVYRNHYISPEHNDDNTLKRKWAEGLLREYESDARLVITNLLHCAMPCLAMQVPVVFLSPQHAVDLAAYRLDPVRDLLPIYTANDDINWNPQPPDISAIAGEIRARARSVAP
jgi:polysaccharide pyruvyl transferase